MDFTMYFAILSYISHIAALNLTKCKNKHFQSLIA